jgi:hypothetical protein
MHLTNYAINKNSQKFDKDERPGHGSKRTIKSVFEILKDNGLNTERLWNRISEVILKTIISVQPAVRKTLKACSKTERDHELGSQCFEILGFDIFIDNKLKPWLIEVNHSPSFTCDSSLDKKIKKGVLSDTLRLVSLDPNLEKRFKKEQKEKSKSRLFPSTNVNSTASSNSNISSASKASQSNISPSRKAGGSPSPSVSGKSSKKSLLKTEEASKIASAAEATVESVEENGKSKIQSLDIETVNRLLSTYHQSYPETLLEQIGQIEEDRGLGGKNYFSYLDRI